MAEMRAMVVLAALLSLAMPGVSARTIELQSPISVTLSLKSPAASVPDLHRAAGKADHPHSFGSVPTAYRVIVPVSTIERAAPLTQEPPSLDRHGPPLAPRPPPV